MGKKLSEHVWTLSQSISGTSPYLWTLSQSISGYFTNKGKAFLFVFRIHTLLTRGGGINGRYGLYIHSDELNILAFYIPFWKPVHVCRVAWKGPQSQTIMFKRLELCLEPQSQFPKIFHQAVNILQNQLQLAHGTFVLASTCNPTRVKRAFRALNARVYVIQRALNARFAR